MAAMRAALDANQGRPAQITMPGLMTRIAQRLLTLAAGIWHNSNTGNPSRSLIAYDH